MIEFNVFILPHLLTLSLCLFVIFYSIGNLRCLSRVKNLPPAARKEKINDGVLPFLLWACLAQIVMMLSFIIMQSNWIISDYDSVTSDLASVGWYVFDLANTFTQLMIALAIRVYMKWKRSSDFGCANYKPGDDPFGIKEIKEDVANGHNN